MCAGIPDWARGRLKFRGATIIDAIEAGALKNLGDTGERAVAAAAAGMDIVLCSARDVQAPDAEPDVARYRHVPSSRPTAPVPPPGELPRVLLTLGPYLHPGADLRLRAAADAASALGAQLVVALDNAGRGSTHAGWPAGVQVMERLDLPAERRAAPW